MAKGLGPSLGMRHQKGRNRRAGTIKLNASKGGGGVSKGGGTGSYKYPKGPFTGTGRLGKVGLRASGGGTSLGGYKRAKSKGSR